jgi:hypothetical protein
MEDKKPPPLLIDTFREKSAETFPYLCDSTPDSGLPIPFYPRRVKGFQKFPSVHTKSHVLEIHKCEKYFTVSHNKKSHKMEALAMIIFFSDKE